MINFKAQHGFFKPGWLNTWRPYFLIFLFGFLLYGQTLFFDYTYLDDNALILENYPTISQFKNVGTIFSSDVFLSTPKFYYRPLLNLSFYPEATTTGTAPAIFHLVNIILHLSAVALVFRLLLKLDCAPPLAYFLSLLFLVHPVLTQAVAWIPGRNDPLLVIFVLASLLSFLSFANRPRLRSYLAYLLFLFLALLSKETAVFLPGLVIFYFLFLAPEKVSKSDRWLLVFGSAAIGFIWFLMRHFALGGETLGLSAALVSIFKNSASLIVFLGKAVLPFSLSVVPSLADAKIIYGLIVLPLLILALVFSKAKKQKYLVFGVLWFLFFILPSFIRPNPVDTPDFFEHRLYLPLIGLLIILAEIDWFKKLDFKNKKVQAGAALVLIFFAILTFRHSLNFSNRLTFWRSAVKTSPHSPLAHRNLGVMEYFDGERAAAAKEYQAALALNPNEQMAHNNLGVIYMEDKNWSAAEAEFKAELRINPGYDKALANLSDLAYRQQAASLNNPEKSLR